MFNPTLTIIKKYALDLVCAFLLVSLVLVSCSSKKTDEEKSSKPLDYKELFYTLSVDLNEKYPIDTLFKICVEVPNLYAREGYTVNGAELTVSDPRFEFYNIDTGWERELSFTYDSEEINSKSHERLLPTLADNDSIYTKICSYTELIVFKYSVDEDVESSLSYPLEPTEGTITFQLAYDCEYDSSQLGFPKDGKIRLHFAVNDGYIAFTDRDGDDAREAVGLKPLRREAKRGCAVG